MDHQYREGPAGDHGLGNVAVEVPHEASMAVGAEDDEADLVLLGGLDDPLPSRGGLDGRSLRPEAGLPCKRRSVLGGLLRRLSYLDGLVGVEMALADGHEPDIYRLPYTQDQRISAGDQLSGGIPDGEASEIGAVVCEQHWTDRLQRARWSRHPVS
jgi:hypothetical protein